MSKMDSHFELMITGDARRFAVTIKGHPNLVGAVGYDITAKTPIGRTGHMGWFLLPEHQNRGYITEATKRVLAYAFDDDNCVRITTGCYAENIPTQKVIAKVGFIQEAEKYKAQWHDGKMKDRLEYAINKDDWEIQKEIAYYNSLPVQFDDFIELPMLSDGEIYLVCTEKYVGPPEKKHVPAYKFAICKGSEKIGNIDIRIGYGGGLKGDNLYYGGHIGYGINEKHRGNGYAVRACRLLLPIAKAHGMTKLLITNDISNNASKRVCEKEVTNYAKDILQRYNKRAICPDISRFRECKENHQAP